MAFGMGVTGGRCGAPTPTWNAIELSSPVAFADRSHTGELNPWHSFLSPSGGRQQMPVASEDSDSPEGHQDRFRCDRLCGDAGAEWAERVIDRIHDHCGSSASAGFADALGAELGDR